MMSSAVCADRDAASASPARPRKAFRLEFSSIGRSQDGVAPRGTIRGARFYRPKGWPTRCGVGGGADRRRGGGVARRGQGGARLKQKPPRGPRPSGAWRSLAEASESIASLVAVVLIHGPTSSGGVRPHRTTPTRSAQLWWARNVAAPLRLTGSQCRFLPSRWPLVQRQDTRDRKSVV